MAAASSLSEIQLSNSLLTLSGTPEDQGKQLQTESLFEDGRFFKRENFLYYNDRARIRFTLAGEFSSHFILVKGLTEFYRPKNLKFAFDNRKTITIDLAVVEINDLVKLLRMVQQELLREISFKKALRRAIEFEKRYRLEAAEVYASQGVQAR